MGFGGYSYNGGFQSTQGIEGRAKYKRVHNTAQVAHVWAQQVNPDGRNSKGALCFKGRTIYSYNSGWPLASFIKPGVVLVNTEKFSVSTTGHLSDVRGALRGSPDTTCISVDSCKVLRAFLHWSGVDLEAGVGAMRAHLIEQLKNTLDAALNLRKSQSGCGYVNDVWARFPDSLERRVSLVRSAVTDANATLAKLGSAPLDFDLQAATAAIESAWNDHYSPAKVAKREKASIARNKRECGVKCKEAIDIPQGKKRLSHGRETAFSMFERYLPAFCAERPESEWRPIVESLQNVLIVREVNEAFRDANPDAQLIVNERRWNHGKNRVTAEVWVDGASGYFQQSYPTLVRRKGNKLETSRGADAPFAHAVAIFKQAQHCRHTGTSWKRNGKTMQAGHFQLESIDTDGNIIIGCHTIEFAEMQRLALRECPEVVTARYPLPALIAA